MASTLTTDFAHLQIPLDDVIKATNNFSDKNIIGKGDFGNVYKGQYHNSSGELIKISARRLDRRYGQGDIEFWTEISMLSNLKHENIVSMIGFCDEKGEKIIVHHRYPKGSLLMHLSDANLTWDQRQNIIQCIGRAIEYMHNLPGESYHIIHRNINSSTILLDGNWETKLSGFEFSVKQSKDRKTQVFTCEPTGTQGYIDPETDNSGGVTIKSDIYSFGIVMLEMMCGRKAFVSNDDDNMFLAASARAHYENNTIRDMMHPDLEDQMKPDPIHCYLGLMFHCIEEKRTLRWSTDDVTLQLKTAIELERGYNLNQKLRDHSNATAKISASFKPTKVKKLDHLRIELGEIKLATNDFDSEHRTFSCSYYASYSGDLECIDRDYLSDVSMKNTDQLPRRSYNVKIKHIKRKEYMSETEIEILGSCKHRNIQSFLGFCDEGPGMILVFEKLPRFGLHGYLDEPKFTWEKRLKVCLDMAHGLSYLQSEMENQKMVIHRDIQSENIMVDDNWRASIVGFQHAVYLPLNQRDDGLRVNNNLVITGEFRNKSYCPPKEDNWLTLFYTDPEYTENGRLNIESDVFSFGVVLFEILCGRRVCDIVSNEGCLDKRLEHVVGRWYQKGIAKNKVAICMQEESSENAFLEYSGLNKDSLDTFIAIAYQCLAEKQNQRPTMKVVIEELEKSLSYQENHKACIVKMSFEDIRSATKNFTNVIGEGGFGSVYIGEVAEKHCYGHNAIVAKKLDTSHGQGHPQFYNELQILYKYKHENIIGLVGYSNETDEKLIVYERASKGSLDKYLSDAKLKWSKRLMICIDIASGLDFLHGGVGGQNVVIHRDIKTPNILLFNDWKAKLGDFGLSMITTIDNEKGYTIDRACGTKGYVDPMYLKTNLLTIESDIYSFGVVLFEILCGRASYKIPNLEGRSLLGFIKHNFEEGKQDEIVFRAIKKEIVPESLSAFIDILYKCLDLDRGKRPTSKEVLAQLKKALQFQDEKNDIQAKEGTKSQIAKIQDEEEHIKSQIAITQDEEEGGVQSQIADTQDDDERIISQIANTQDEEESVNAQIATDKKRNTRGLCVCLRMFAKSKPSKKLP